MPQFFIEAPAGIRPEAKQTMMREITVAIDEAYGELADTAETLILMNLYPLENAGFAGRMQSDNPEIVEAVGRLNA